ncbi:MAG: DUF4981 domain-containing protein, partial [Cyclobacteriaceae bacterium]|nr:DUF4981 domain-containing protein [Cyclobacteriaceae bacterium]
NLNEFDISYSLGEPHKTGGNIEIDLLPHQSKIIELPIKELDFITNESLTGIISIRLKEDTKWAKKGHEVAWEQLTYPDFPPLGKYDKNSKISIEETQDAIILTGKKFEYEFNKNTGKLSRMLVNGKTIVLNSPMFNVWRAPIANDTDPWNNGKHRTQEKIDGLGRSRDNHWRTMGIDHLQYQVDNIEVFDQSDYYVEVKVSETAYTSTKEGGFKNQYEYHINAKGELSLFIKTMAQGKMPQWLPRIGLQFQLPQEFQHVEWYGRGPQENYPDRKTGYKIGNYTSTVDEMYVPYLIPQDYGNRSDVSFVKLTNEEGIGLIIQGFDFNFSAHNFTTDNLERAMYPFQLKKSDKVYLNIDHKVNGLGDTSLSTLREHRVLPGTYEFSYTIKPVR